MRKSILLYLFLLLSVLTAVPAFTQDGTSCGANAYPIPLNSSCDTYPHDGYFDEDGNFIFGDPLSTGSRVYCNTPPATYPNASGKFVWFRFQPNDLSACVRMRIDARTESGTHYPAEVAFYPSCPPTENSATNLDGNGSLCLADGQGIWSPPAGYAWADHHDYYLRVFVFYNGAERIDIEICGQQYTPENDACFAALPIPVTGGPDNAPPVEDDNVCGTSTTQEKQALYNSSATTSPSAGGYNGKWICALSLENTTWYSFKVQGAGSSTIQISGVDCDNHNGAAGNFIQAGLLTLKPGRSCTDAFNSAGAGSGSPFESVQYSGGTPPRATGSGLPNPGTAACLNLPNGAQNSAALTTASLAAGTIVYLAIDGFDGSNCKYKIEGVSNIVPIPIRLKYFIVWKKGSYNLVNWVTSWEQNNKYFEIERSTDGVNYTSIGTVNGHNKSDNETNYNFEDKNPPQLAYYRLKQVDLDEKFTYSNVVKIIRDDVNAYLDAVITNPVYGAGKIIINTRRAGMVNMSIVNTLGEHIGSQIIQCVPGKTTVVKDFSKLPAGNYYLLFVQGDEKFVKPFIKQ